MKYVIVTAVLLGGIAAARAECHHVFAPIAVNTVTCRQVCTGWPGTGSNDYRNPEPVPHVQKAQSSCETICDQVPGGRGAQSCRTRCY